jgi:hypothetical protein
LPGADHPDVQAANITVGSLAANCGPGLGSFQSCSGNLGSSSGTVVNGILPFTLGQVFAFHQDLNLQANSTRAGVFESGVGNNGFTFTLLDANGTPVLIYAVPEPSTLALLSCGFSCLLLICRARMSNINFAIRRTQCGRRADITDRGRPSTLLPNCHLS